MKIAVGVITYGEGTAKYLPYFLASLKEQTANNFDLLVYDNTDNGLTTNKDLLVASGINFRFFGNGANLGFGKAYNALINHAINSGADCFLALNPDMLIEPAMLAFLTATLEAEPDAGAVVPKILRWDFENKSKTRIIDSLGLVLDQYFRFFDDQQGLPDTVALKTKKEIFGFTGAAVLLRLKAMRDIRFEQEFFDELMFMYKEDCDLSMRLRLAGWKIFLEPQAIAYHDRTAANVGQSLAQIAGGRKLKSKTVKQWSFLNQLILLYKFSAFLTWRVRIRAWSYEFLSIGYAVIFETYLMRELMVFLRLRKQVQKKSSAMPINSNPRELDKYFIK